MFHTTGRTISHTPGPSSAPTTAAATQYTNRQTTSSSATTCISASTNGPLALYCRTVIIVLAGAVAVAMAAMSSEKSALRPNSSRIARKTTTPESSASKSVTIKIRGPVERMTSRLK